MRLLAWLLAAYAALGVVLVVAALLVGGPLVSRFDRLTASALDTVAAATEAADAAADAFDGFDVSLEEAGSSAAEAAELSRNAAGTLDSLSAAMGLTLLGAQPLLPLADQFERSAGQMLELGDNLDAIGASLSGNRDDVARVGERMRELAGELGELEAGIADERLGGSIPLTWLYYGFLLWQVLPIVAAAVGALWLFRQDRPVEMAADESARS